MQFQAKQDRQWQHGRGGRGARGWGSTRAGRHAGGYTLIEILIVVIIVGVLMAVAIPSYINSVRKSHRAEAKTALLDLAAREERYYTVNNSYTGSATALGYATAFPINLDTKPYFQLSISGSTASTYNLLAQAQGDQQNDACGNYMLDNFGNQTNSTATTGCW
jgi:type IV pilus assembly protein PilE